MRALEMYRTIYLDDDKLPLSLRMTWQTTLTYPTALQRRHWTKTRMSCAWSLPISSQWHIGTLRVRGNPPHLTRVVSTTSTPRTAAAIMLNQGRYFRVDSFHCKPRQGTGSPGERILVQVVDFPINSSISRAELARNSDDPVCTG